MNTTNGYVLAVFAAVLAVFGNTTVEVIKHQVLEPSFAPKPATIASPGSTDYTYSSPEYTQYDYYDEYFSPSKSCTSYKTVNGRPNPNRCS